jgi:hypothetical protein
MRMWQGRGAKHRAHRGGSCRPSRCPPSPERGSQAVPGVGALQHRGPQAAPRGPRPPPPPPIRCAAPVGAASVGAGGPGGPRAARARPHTSGSPSTDTALRAPGLLASGTNAGASGLSGRMVGVEGRGRAGRAGAGAERVAVLRGGVGVCRGVSWWLFVSVWPPIGGARGKGGPRRAAWQLQAFAPNFPPCPRPRPGLPGASEKQSSRGVTPAGYACSSA